MKTIYTTLIISWILLVANIDYNTFNIESKTDLQTQIEDQRVKDIEHQKYLDSLIQKYNSTKRWEELTSSKKEKGLKKYRVKKIPIWNGQFRYVTLKD